ncbi:uncharacterized protein LOC121836532 [Ixodes scapularis]|uniref:uncharacterized protein LOC121836532 n=1 Tax=Ixodes scapularis TaxID=6945 RepID=UPI001C38DD2F|nr:uncharacterized protein LOC121836532 [Ixodes scapularis]
MDRLKPKRSAQRAQNTRLINDADTILNDPQTDLGRLHAVKDRLSASNIELDRINEELEPLLPTTELENEYASVAGYQDHAIRVLAELRYKIEHLEITRRTPVPPTTAPLQGASESIPPVSGPRLPKLDITIFKGDISHWRTFWEQFDRTIHSNRALSTTDKFQYLRRYLAGDAASAIAGLPTTERCYADAIELLKQRFGDPKRIEQAHPSALRNLPQIRSSVGTRGLRKLYDSTQLNIRCLNALDVPTASFAAMLSDIPMKAMPYDIVVQYHQQVSYKLSSNANLMQGDGSASETSTAASNLNEILSFLRIKVESRERSGHPAARGKEQTDETKDQSQPAASALHSAAPSAPGECLFCHSKKHETQFCDAQETL